ncbi:MAG: quinol monooxygenase YgiN [Halioglobus sp.]|jgi:quinol monooxygenase YgiN
MIGDFKETMCESFCQYIGEPDPGLQPTAFALIGPAPPACEGASALHGSNRSRESRLDAQALSLPYQYRAINLAVPNTPPQRYNHQLWSKRNTHKLEEAAMAIGVIATLTIREGRNSAFEQAFSALTEQVRANEPGNIFYVLHRSKSDPQVYKVLEQYESEADLKAHGKTEYFLEANKILATMVAAAPHVEVLDTV